MHFSTTCIDNFFKYPNAIRKYANSLEYSPDEAGKWPGVRSKPLQVINESLWQEICEKYLANFYPMESLTTGQIQYKSDAVFQKVNNKYGRGWIHNDGKFVHTTIVYLTPNVPDDSGTSIYIPKEDSMPQAIPGTVGGVASRGDVRLRVEGSVSPWLKIEAHVGKQVKCDLVARGGAPVLTP